MIKSIVIRILSFIFPVKKKPSSLVLMGSIRKSNRDYDPLCNVSFKSWNRWGKQIIISNLWKQW